MSNKKIFIAISQREARSIVRSIEFTALACSKKVGETFIFSPENAELIGIAEIALYELQDFAERIEHLADEQAELEASIENPESSIPVRPDRPGGQNQVSSIENQPSSIQP